MSRSEQLKIVVRRRKLNNHSELESPADVVKKKFDYVNVAVS